MHLTNGEPRAAQGQLPLSDYTLIARLLRLSQIALHISLFSRTWVVGGCKVERPGQAWVSLQCSNRPQAETQTPSVRCPRSLAD